MIKMKKRTIHHVALPFCLFLCGFFLGKGWYGMWLMDAPEPEHVVSVGVYAHGTFTEDKVMTAVLTDPERIEMACSLVQDLQYSPFRCGKCFVEPEVCFTFAMDDGSEDVIGTARGGLYRNGKSYSLTRHSAFEDSAKLLFHLEAQE